MKKIKFLLIISFIVQAISVSIVMAQKQDCEVRQIGISKEYNGECKKGLAHGSGVASGELGTYNGNFTKGLPSGNGKMEYVNGQSYDGEWKLGLKNGKGVMTISKDSTLIGFWKEDKYIGEYEYPYKILSTYGSIRVSIRKVGDDGNKIDLVFMRQGMINQKDIIRLALQSDSGVEQRGQYLGYLDVNFPFEGKIDCDVKNMTGSTDYTVSVRYKIFEKGHWRVSIDY